MNQPQDPMTPIVEMTSHFHEMFLAYRSAGFNERQALYLVGQMVRESIAQSKGAADDD